jgi:ABC-type transporter Mla subunit MlaD
MIDTEVDEALARIATQLDDAVMRHENARSYYASTVRRWINSQERFAQEFAKGDDAILAACTHASIFWAQAVQGIEQARDAYTRAYEDMRRAAWMKAQIELVIGRPLPEVD